MEFLFLSNHHGLLQRWLHLHGGCIESDWVAQRAKLSEINMLPFWTAQAKSIKVTKTQLQLGKVECVENEGQSLQQKWKECNQLPL